MASRREAPHGAWVGLRLGAGALLFHAGRGLFRDGSSTGERVAALVGQDLAERGFPLSFWGESVLLQNPDAVAFLWPWLLVVTGALLAVGFLVRPAGCAAAFALIQAALYGSPQAVYLHLLLALCALCLAAAQAGRRLGLDGLLADSLPDWLTWSKPARR